jgi:hypothetical protein
MMFDLPPLWTRITCGADSAATNDPVLTRLTYQIGAAGCLRI